MGFAVSNARRGHYVYHHRPSVQGHVHRGFETVGDVFAENFTRRRERGGACCAIDQGEKVVDLWGRYSKQRTREPWEKDTMVIVHSATKGLAR
jgi:CubicO group peptidase (beta-lactamase class C family)